MSYRGGPPEGRGRGRGGPPRGGGDGGRGGRGGSPGDRGRGGGGFDRGGGRGGGGYDRGGGRGGGGYDRGGRGGGDRGGRGGGDRGRGRGGPGGGRGGFEPAGIFQPGPVELDQRLRDDSQAAIVRSLQQLTLTPTDLPVRPDFGTKGQQIKVRANFFPVKVPKIPLYEYDIAITPKAKELAKRIKKRIFELAEKTPDWTARGLRGRVAHDSSAKLISSTQLQQPLAINVLFYDEDEEPPKSGGKMYTMEFKYIQPIDTGNLINYLEGHPQYRDYDIMPVVSALNVILASFPNRSNGPGVMVGRNRWFFRTADSTPSTLGGGLEAWRGFYSSVRPAHNQLMVNVNVCTTAFYTPGNLARAITEFERASWGARPNAFVKGVRIRATHLGYKKTVKGISDKTAKTYKFKVEEFGGKLMSVEEYFFKKYKITLDFPDMPLVDVGAQKSNLLPAEVCEILPDQAFKGKLTEDQTASMIRVAARPPNVNASAIASQGLRELGFANPNTFQAFDVAVRGEMAVVPARQLPVPGVRYANNNSPEVDIAKASWNLRKIRFHKGALLSNWGVLILFDNGRDDFENPSDPQIRGVIEGFHRMCKDSGMNTDLNARPNVVCARLPPRNRDDAARNGAIQTIEQTLRTLPSKPSIVLVILSSGDKLIYNGIKTLCDTQLDIATVCAQAAKIRKEKGQLQYFANVALKFNMKLGGVNHVLDPSNMAWLKQRPTMLVGIDVTHPSPGSISGTPSIAAVVASADKDFSQYPASMQIQESKKEMVTNLDEMMVERLTLFRQRNKVLPDRILVYRDGVSEGQFKIVIEEEMPKIKEAFRKFDHKAPYMPQLTIVVCGKRHHTRFYPTNAADADDKGNPKPGMVVDRGVTSIYHFDFFLQAHGGLQGSTRPTHYYVVHDEIGFDSDTVQGLTHAVSYMFARATKAVSLVSPAYYADLACERGRCYLSKLLLGVGGAKQGSGSDKDAVVKDATALWNGGVSGNALKDTMFYL